MMVNGLEPSFHLRFLGEQVLHSSYSSASYGWLAHKLAAFSEADNAVVVKLEEEGVVLRKLDTSAVITRLPFVSNCQSFIHNRELNLFSIVGSDSEARDLHRLLVFRAASLDIIKEFSSCLRKAVLASAFLRTNSIKSMKSASHMSNFFEVFYLGRARFSQFTKPLTPEYVDKAVIKLSQEISAAGGGLPNSKTFHSNPCDEKTQHAEKEEVLNRPRSHTIAGNSVDLKDLLSSKCLSPSNPNRTLLIQLTETEVFLISPTAKTILLRVPFSEITAGCQGLENSQCFAFLTSASESISTTESGGKVKPKNDNKNPLFSPTQSTVTTMWAYILMCADEHSSSNAILSLQTCIRDPQPALPGVLKECSNNNNNNSSNFEKEDKNCSSLLIIKRSGEQGASLLCDACPVRDFNVICASLISDDQLASDDEKLARLNDYVNNKLSRDDAAFIRQLLPKSAPSAHALICDVIFALFQLTEYNRATHVHIFDSCSKKQAATSSDPISISNKKAPEKQKKMLTSSSFSGPSFVDVLREKMSLKTKRRGSITGAFFSGNGSADEKEPEEPEPQRTRISFDLKALVSNSNPNSTKKGSSNSSEGDIFREYVIVSNAELARLPSAPLPGKDRASSPSVIGRYLSTNLEETPKSASKSGGGLKVPGSEPLSRYSSRRCTFDANSSVLRNTFRTPLARFEQFSTFTPSFSSSNRRHSPLSRVATTNLVTPELSNQQHTHLERPSLSHQISVRRRSIFEMVVCPVPCTSIDSVVNPEKSLPPPPQIQVTNASDLSLFPSLIDPESKQLDYEEPLGGCTEETAVEWQKIIGLKPEISKQQTNHLEGLLSQGIPKQLRGRVWMWLMKRELCLLSKGNDKIPSISPQEYADLLSNLTPCNQQILMDLGRTFPNHLYFAQHFGAGQLALFNILKAYSLIDPEVGYCQGISFIAGILLMHSASEYDAFNLLLGLMFGFGFRTVYLPNMEGLHRCLYQLTRLLDTELPAVFEHLTLNDVLPVFFASPWFVTIFSSQFPLGFAVRVFDLVFYGNVEMLFRVIFSLFSINEPLLLSRTGGFEDVVDFLKTTFCEMSVIQLERIVAKVFSLNFSVELHRYAVEYDIYREEQDVSPVRLIENVALNSVNSPPGKEDANNNNNGEMLVKEHEAKRPALATQSSEESQEEASSSSSSSYSPSGNKNANKNHGGMSIQRDLAVSRHKVVELRAERSELLEKIEQMQAKIVANEGEIMRLESLNETLRTENAILRASSSSVKSNK